jgi:hypothetical protein
VSPRGDRPLRSGCRRGRLLGRNCSVAATGRWRGRESTAAADAVVVPFCPEHAVLVRPLVPVRPVGILFAVAHLETAGTPDRNRVTPELLPTWAVVVRQVRLVRVWRISAGNRRRRHNRRSTAQHSNAKTAKPHLHFGPLRCCSHTVSHPPPRSRRCQAQVRWFRRGRCRCPRSGWAGRSWSSPLRHRIHCRVRWCMRGHPAIRHRAAPGSGRARGRGRYPDGLGRECQRKSSTYRGVPLEYLVHKAKTILGDKVIAETLAVTMLLVPLHPDPAPAPPAPAPAPIDVAPHPEPAPIQGAPIPIPLPPGALSPSQSPGPQAPAPPTHHRPEPPAAIAPPQDPCFINFIYICNPPQPLPLQPPCDPQLNNLPPCSSPTQTSCCKP